jgi:hypothetical protein
MLTTWRLCSWNASKGPVPPSEPLLLPLPPLDPPPLDPLLLVLPPLLDPELDVLEPPEPEPDPELVPAPLLLPPLLPPEPLAPGLPDDDPWPSHGSLVVELLQPATAANNITSAPDTTAGLQDTLRMATFSPSCIEREGPIDDRLCPSRARGKRPVSRRNRWRCAERIGATRNASRALQECGQFGDPRGPCHSRRVTTRT